MADNNKKILLTLCTLCLTGTTLGRNEPTVRWGHQYATPSNSSLFGTMVADSNDGIYLAIQQRFQDAAISKPKDQYLLKFNQEGDEVWRRQIGVNRAGERLHFAVDGLAADKRQNIYIFGDTTSKLGPEQRGGHDAFVAKYDQAGVQQWVWQLGSAQHDGCNGLAIDADGNLYVAGSTKGSFAKPNKGESDITLAAYNPMGTCLWKDQIGTGVKDYAVDVRVAPNSDIYLCAQTSGSLARQSNGQLDFVVARYSRSGRCLWLRQYGSQARDIAVCLKIGEHGQVYVGGITYGNLAHARSQLGYGDAFVVRIAETGEIIWKRQFGSRGWDKTWQMACFHDGSGDILVGGCQYPAGKRCQAFCHRYSAQGDRIWTKLFGKRRPQSSTCGRAVVIDSANNAYLAGGSGVSLFGGVSKEERTLFIVRLDDKHPKQAAKE